METSEERMRVMPANSINLVYYKSFPRIMS